MSTHAMLIQSLKHKAAFFKVSFLLVATTALSSCLGLDCALTETSTGDTYLCPSLDGGGNVAVNYISPVAGQVFTQANLAFEVEFPNNNIPSNVEIRINGAVVTDDFSTSGNSLIVPVVSLGASPLVWNALRDGSNVFQVTNPVKGLITFFVDFEDPRIHLLSVDDGWRGITRKVCRGGWSGGSLPHLRCTGYDKDNDAAVYAQCSDGSTQTEGNRDNCPNGEYTLTAHKYFPQPKRGNVIVEGYIEGEDYSAVSSLSTTVSRIDGSGVKQSLSVNGANMYSIPGRAVTYGAVPAPTAGVNPAIVASPAPNNVFRLDFGTAGRIDLGNMEPGACVNPICYLGTNSGWVTTGEAGMAATGSGFTPTVPQGSYVMFIQRLGSASKTFTVPSNGNYVLSFYAMQRGAQQQAVSFRLQAGTGPINEIAKIRAASSTPAGYSLRLNKLVAGTTYTLGVVGLNPNGVDETSFFDYFSLTQNFDFVVNAHDKGNHDDQYNENEGDHIRFDVCKTVIGTDTYATNQCTSKEWMRSNIPLTKQRLNKGGAFSIAFDRVSMLSTGAGVLELVTDTNYASPPILADAVVTTINLSRIIVESALIDQPNEGIFLTFPSQSNPNKSVLDINASLPVDIYGTFNLGGTCRVNDTGNTTYDQRVELSFVPGAAAGFAKVDFVGGNGGGLGLNISISGTISVFGIQVPNPLCAIAGSIVGAADGTIQTILRNTVGGVIANDLPTTRVEFGLVTPLGSQLGPFFLPIQPEVSNFSGKNKTGGAGGVWDVKWLVDLGLHTRGVKLNHNSPKYGAVNTVRNVSLGTSYSGNTLQEALLNFDPTENESKHGTSLGVSVTEDFVNQLFMGLWESGFLYIDFDIDSPGMSNPFLANVNFAFASTQPWQIEISDTAYGSSLPNFKITIPDLLINFTGDLYWPVPSSNQCIANGQPSNCIYLKDFEFARMLGDVVIYSELSASPDGSSLRLRMTQALEVDVTEVSSDWDNTSEAELVAALDYAFTTLTGGMTIDLPFPDIIASTVRIDDVDTDADAIYLAIDVYNPACFPGGPDLVGLFDPLCRGTTDVIFNWPADSDSRTIDATGYTYGVWSIKMEPDGFVRVRRGNARVVEFGNGASANASTTASWQSDGHLVIYNPAPPGAPCSGTACWASGWALPNGTNTAPKATDSLVLLSDGRLMIYDNALQVVRYTFPRLVGTYLTGLSNSDFTPINAAVSTVYGPGTFTPLVDNNFTDGQFHMDVSKTDISIGSFESGFTCAANSRPHDGATSWANEEQRASNSRNSYGCGWSTCYSWNGDTTFSWVDPGGTTRTTGAINGNVTVATVQSRWNTALSGTGGTITVTGGTFDADGNDSMYFRFGGAYAGLNVNQISVSKTGDGTISMSTTQTGNTSSRAMGTAPLTGGGNYCYGAKDGNWTGTGDSGGVVVAASGSGFNPNAPEGSYALVLQRTEEAQKTFTVANTGTYYLTFSAAQRDFPGNDQSVTLQLNGVNIMTIKPAEIATAADKYRGYSTDVDLTAGMPYTLKFVGTPPDGGDHTIFIDDVRLQWNANKGFKIDLGGPEFVTGVNLNGRTGQEARLNGLRVQLYKNGKKVGQSAKVASATDGTNLILFNYKEADEVRLMSLFDDDKPDPWINFDEIQVRTVR